VYATRCAILTGVVTNFISFQLEDGPKRKAEVINQHIKTVEATSADIYPSFLLQPGRSNGGAGTLDSTPRGTSITTTGAPH
jgi:hypothetical protein